MKIQPLDLSNSQILKSVYELSQAAHRAESLLIDFSDLPALREGKKNLLKSGETFFGIFRADEVVAAISVKMICGTLEICRLIVHPAYFRRGYGSQLVQFILNEFPKAKTAIVAITTLNKPAHGLFNKLGFHPTRTEKTPENQEITIFSKRCQPTFRHPAR